MLQQEQGRLMGFVARPRIFTKTEARLRGWVDKIYDHCSVFL